MSLQTTLEEGEVDLAAHAARGAPASALFACAADILRALAPLHARGFVHLGVRPQTIHVDAAGKARLLPTDGARAASCSAPEALAGEPCDRRADLFSVGAALYAALCGDRPFAGESARDVLRAQANGRPAPPRARRPDVTPAQEAALLRLLAYDPADRFSSVADALHSLGSALDESQRERAPLDASPLVVSGRLVGRDRELSALRVAIESAEPRALLISGPPGSGKSRLLAEAARQAQIAGTIFLSCDAARLDAERPFGAARALLDLLSAELAEVPPAFPALARARAALASPAHPDEAPSRRPGVVADALREAAHGRAVVLAIDDVEGASEETIDLARELLRGFAGDARAPIALLLAARTDFAGPLLRALHPGGKPPGLEEIALEPLSDDDAAEQVRSTLSIPAVPRAVGATLAAEARGLPGALDALVRAAWAASHASGESLDALAHLALALATRPPAATPFTRAIELLPSDARKLLIAAAGPRAPLELSRIADRASVSASRSRDAAALLRDAGILVERACEEDDSLDESAAAKGLSIATRALADAARDARGSSLREADAIEPARALDDAVAAADLARQAGARSRARRLLRQALALAEAGHGAASRGSIGRRALATSRVPILEALGDECLHAAESALAGSDVSDLAREAASAFERVADAADRRADRVSLARAHVRIAQAERAARRREEAAAALGRAERALSSASSAARRGEAYAHVEATRLRLLGEIALEAGELPRAIEHLEHASSVASQEGGGEGAGEQARLALVALGEARLREGKSAAARELAQRAFAAGGRALGRGLLEVHALAARAARRAGDLPAAREAHASALAIAEDLGDRAAAAEAHCGLGELDLAADDADAARRRFASAIALGSLGARDSDPRLAARALVGAAEAALKARDPDAAARSLEAAVATTAQLTPEARAAPESLFERARAQTLLGLIRLGRGEVERARAAFDGARDALAARSGGADTRTLEAQALRGEGEARAAQGDLGAAQPLVSRAITIADEAGDLSESCLASVALARILTRKGEIAAARARVVAAERRLEAEGPRRAPALVRALEAHLRAAGAALLAIGGDCESARRIARALPAVAAPCPSCDPAADRAEALLFAGEPEAALYAVREARGPRRALLEGRALLETARLVIASEAAPPGEGGAPGRGFALARPAAVLDEARLALARALETARAGGLHSQAREAALASAEVALLKGDDDAAGRSLAEAREGALDERLLLARAAARAIELASRRGRNEEAHAVLRDAASWVPALGAPALEADLRIAAARARRQAGDIEGARDSCDRAEALLDVLVARARVPGLPLRHPHLLSLREALRVESAAIAAVPHAARLSGARHAGDDALAIAASDAAAAERESALRAEIAGLEDRARTLEERLDRAERERHREREDLHRALEASRRELESKYEYANIVGRSDAMRSLFLVLDKITDSRVSVLLHGESGTGKELVAKAIHFNGPRRHEPFLSINCAALPETLLESELFGYARGAFTGADRDKLGLFEAAHRGTLFLDEVSECSPGMQVKLLRVLQEGEIRPVGGKHVRKIDVRIVSACNQDLKRLVEAGRFRTDLYYRLNVVHVTLPPLRERREDIPLLVEHFLETLEGGAKKQVGTGVMEALYHYHWPGNVRELENEVRRAIALSGPEILASDLSAHVKKPNVERYDIGHPEGLTLKARLEILERRIIKEALARVGGNKTACAKELGLSRFGFLKKLDKYGLR